MAPHSSTLVWQIPWTEEPGGLQSVGSRRVRTWLSNFTFTFHFHALEKEMAAHSSVLAWRIPGTGEPGGLPSMGSHRVGHNWSDLVAAAAAADSTYNKIGTVQRRLAWLLTGTTCKFMKCSIYLRPLWRTVWRFLNKLKIEQPYDPAIPLLGIYLEKTIIWKDTYTPVFLAALYTIVRTQKQPKCPSTEEWLEKMWYTYAMEYYYPALKRSEIVPFEDMWMDIQTVRESE